MGSGKGKARRAQVASITATYFTANMALFQAFVRKQGLLGMRMVDYYGLPNPGVNDYYSMANPMLGKRDERSLDQWRVALATEFFKDLVDVGTIPLPSGVKAEDFAFEIDKDDEESDVKSLYVTYPGAAERARVALCPQLVYNEDTTMGATLWDVAQDMCKAAEDVLRNKKRS